MSVLSNIDATLAALLPAVAQQQGVYFATHGVYYQMLWTHKEPPTQPAPPDNLTALPIGQAAGTVAGLPGLMRSRMRIDTYGKPDGWTMTLQASVNGEVWQRSIDCGVNSIRSTAWVVPSLPPESSSPVS
jgi:hypothetical protein